ncbi:MAG: deoxyribose-phosphate aldolase [Actinomycetota bacterium]
MAEAPSGMRSMIELAIRCLDLTSLDGSETPERIRALCERAIRPAPDTPSVAAVVVYPPHVVTAADALRDSDVKVATVVGFPIPTEPLPKRLAEIHSAIELGATEIDMVLNREALEAGRSEEAADEITQAKEAADLATLKVILETGELRTDERIHRAALLAMSAGADFLKTSTGKVGTGATPEAAVVMMRAVGDFHGQTGKAVGVKISGGIRTADQALGYLEIVEGELGEGWLTPDRFRIGASTLLEVLLSRPGGQ